MQELAEELVKTQPEIVAIQEIRWSGTGLIKKKDFSLYCSGTIDQTGHAGTGFIILGGGLNIYNNAIIKLTHFIYKQNCF